ncbi:MAG: hypothetical protein IPK16_13900 [Anaerolineales bacterium]|nr:hypothetical protein [Anaerolineales bacterium]
MKYIVIALLLIHGLICTLGFVKAFGFATVAQLQAPISRPVGLLWLAAALLLVASGVMLLLGSTGWWVLAAGGVVLSQILIFGAWSDARAGTIVNVILLIPITVAALGVAPWSFRAMYQRDVATAFQQSAQTQKPLTEADIAHLPPVVQRYLAFVGAIGKPQVWNYAAHMRCDLRNGPDDNWMAMTVEQQSFVNPPARHFLIEGTVFGVPFGAYHRYVGPSATFQVRAASLFTLVDAKGAEMNQGETVTVLNDMFMLAPATLIDPNITWEELSPLTVRATWTNAGNTVSADVTFDESGALVDFVSGDRYRTADGKQYELLPWSTPVNGWRKVDGRRQFSSGEALWELPTGKFAYGRMELLDIAYNVSD